MSLTVVSLFSRRLFDSRGHHVRLRHASSAPDTSEMKQMQTFTMSGATAHSYPHHGHCSSLPASPKKRYTGDNSPGPKSRTLGRQQSLGRHGEYAHIWEIRRPIPVSTPKVPPAGERSEPDGCTPRNQSLERSERRVPEFSEDLPLPPATFMTFKPLGDHVYESPRFASLSKGGSKNSSRSSGAPVMFHADTVTRDGKPIPPRRALDPADRNRLRTMGLGGTGTVQHRYVPEPSPAEEGKITV